MRVKACTLIMSVLFAANGTFADTLTLNDHRSFNGTIDQLSDGVIVFEARFSSGPKTFSFKLRDVDIIEFNATAFNFGAPSKVPGLGPSRGNKAVPQPPLLRDVIVLRSGQRPDCQLTAIDSASIHCGNKTEYPRRIVLRILLGAQ
jgi:hypothetical protein